MEVRRVPVGLPVVLGQGAEVPAYHDAPPVIGSIKTGSPAEKAGLRRGDRVLTVDETPVETWDKFDIEIGTKPNRDIDLSFRSEERRVGKECDSGRWLHA